MAKILQINVEVTRNSTGRIVEQIGNLIINENMQSTIAFSRGPKISNSKLIKIGNVFTILNHVIKTRIFGNHLESSSFATKKLIIEIIELNPDIIHLHQVHGYYLNIPIFFSFLSKYNKPVVWTLHDCWAFTGHCSYFTLVNCYKWKNECNQCPQFNKYPASWFFDNSREQFYLKKELFNKINNITFVTVSDWVRKLAKESFISNNRLMTITNGVDTSIFKYRNDFDELKKKYKIENKFILLGVGTTWNKSKGLFDFIKLSEIINDDTVIVLVGLNSDKFIKNNKKIIQVNKTDSLDDLVKLYSMSDILLSLSYQESFGLTPIEAMACGTPIIVNNVTALPELVTEDVGFTVEPQNFDDILEKIKIIKSRKKEFYSNNCRKRVETFYNKNVNFNSYIKLYKELLK